MKTRSQKLNSDLTDVNSVKRFIMDTCTNKTIQQNMINRLLSLEEKVLDISYQMSRINDNQHSTISISCENSIIEETTISKTTRGKWLDVKNI